MFPPWYLGKIVFAQRLDQIGRAHNRRKISILILGIVLSYGCAEVQTKLEPQGNYAEPPKVDLYK